MCPIVPGPLNTKIDSGVDININEKVLNKNGEGQHNSWIKAGEGQHNIMTTELADRQ